MAHLRSFLGTCGFLMKFIPNNANLSEPLRRLTRKVQEWHWTSETERSFINMKRAMVSQPCVAYSKLDAQTTVISDASPIGLGAVLLQKQSNGKTNRLLMQVAHRLPLRGAILKLNVKLWDAFGPWNTSANTYGEALYCLSLYCRRIIIL